MEKAINSEISRQAKLVEAKIGTFGPSDEEVLAWFEPQKVVGLNVVKLDILRASFIEQARVLLEKIPPCPDRTNALRKLYEASHAAVFAFTHNQES